MDSASLRKSGERSTCSVTGKPHGNGTRRLDVNRLRFNVEDRSARGLDGGHSPAWPSPRWKDIAGRTAGSAGSTVCIEATGSNLCLVGSRAWSLGRPNES